GRWRGSGEQKAKGEKMGDIQHAGGVLTGTGRESDKMDWRRVLLGAGFVLILLAVGVGAVLKQGGGQAPQVLGAVGFLLIGISLVASIITSLWSKVTGQGKPSGGSQS
ncbi:MAG: hypothetical protein WCI75_11480, partial [candidate division NC10 bacterium]